MIISMLAAELFAVKVMGRVMGLIITSDGLAETFGPRLAGAIRAHSGSYFAGFAVLIFLSVIATITV